MSKPPEQLRATMQSNTGEPRSLDTAEVISLIGNLYLQIELLRKHNVELMQKLAALEQR